MFISYDEIPISFNNLITFCYKALSFPIDRVSTKLFDAVVVLRFTDILNRVFYVKGMKESDFGFTFTC